MTTKRQRETSKALGALVPMIPFDEAEQVKALAGQRHLRHLPVGIAVWLSLVAHVRHTRTDYDELLADGYDRDAARHFVAGDINAVLTGWQATRMVDTRAQDADAGFPDPVED